jgi:hypothetical protein
MVARDKNRQVQVQVFIAQLFCGEMGNWARKNDFSAHANNEKYSNCGWFNLIGKLCCARKFLHQLTNK